MPLFSRSRATPECRRELVPRMDSVVPLSGAAVESFDSPENPIEGLRPPLASIAGTSTSPSLPGRRRHGRPCHGPAAASVAITVPGRELGSRCTPGVSLATRCHLTISRRAPSQDRQVATAPLSRHHHASPDRSTNSRPSALSALSAVLQGRISLYPASGLPTRPRARELVTGDGLHREKWKQGSQSTPSPVTTCAGCTIHCTQLRPHGRGPPWTRSAIHRPTPRGPPWTSTMWTDPLRAQTEPHGWPPRATRVRAGPTKIQSISDPSKPILGQPH